jgi:hypothetical protein
LETENLLLELSEIGIGAHLQEHDGRAPEVVRALFIVWDESSRQVTAVGAIIAHPDEEQRIFGVAS